MKKNSLDRTIKFIMSSIDHNSIIDEMAADIAAQQKAYAGVRELKAYLFLAHENKSDIVTKDLTESEAHKVFDSMLTQTKWVEHDLDREQDIFTAHLILQQLQGKYYLALIVKHPESGDLLRRSVLIDHVPSLIFSYI
jgi:hypothetical protein